MSKYVVLGFALMMLLGAVEATPIPRDRKPDFSEMGFLIGRWNCSVNSSRRPRPFSTTATTSMSRDGYWLVTRTITAAVPWNPVTITNTDSVTYDFTTSRWVEISMDDFGAYDVSASPGWSGNTLVWTELVYQKLHGLTTDHLRRFTKRNDTQTVLEQSFVEASGKRVRVTTTCSKVTAKEQPPL